MGYFTRRIRWWWHSINSSPFGWIHIQVQVKVRSKKVSPITGVGGGGRIGPPAPASFSALDGKRLKIGTWNFLDFSCTFIGNVAPNFWVSTLRRGASRTTFSGACLPSFGQFFLQIFGNCKNLIVGDGTCLLRNSSWNLAEIVQETTKLWQF